jgi:hypothetical protein
MISLAPYVYRAQLSCFNSYIFVVGEKPQITDKCTRTEERDQNKGWPSEKDALIIIICPCVYSLLCATRRKLLQNGGFQNGCIIKRCLHNSRHISYT